MPSVRSAAKTVYHHTVVWDIGIATTVAIVAMIAFVVSDSRIALHCGVIVGGVDLRLGGNIPDHDVGTVDIIASIAGIAGEPRVRPEVSMVAGIIDSRWSVVRGRWSASLARRPEATSAWCGL
jgi:hypothetical protein